MIGFPADDMSKPLVGNLMRTKRVGDALAFRLKGHPRQMQQLGEPLAVSAWNLGGRQVIPWIRRKNRAELPYRPFDVSGDGLLEITGKQAIKVILAPINAQFGTILYLFGQSVISAIAEAVSPLCQ